MASHYHLDELLEKYGLMLEHDSCRGTHLFVTGGGPDGGADAPTAQVLAYIWNSVPTFPTRSGFWRCCGTSRRWKADGI